MRSNLTEIDLCHACGPLVTRYVLGTRRACFGRDVRERPADADPSGPLGRAGPCRPHPSPNACLLMATTAANPVHNGRWVLSPQYLPITPRAQRPFWRAVTRSRPRALALLGLGSPQVDRPAMVETTALGAAIAVSSPFPSWNWATLMMP
jgi:hypothetical protein